MVTGNTQSEKEKQFHQLHNSGRLLVLPNIWDPLGSLLLEDLGYPAIATASASIALTNGYPDDEKIPFSDLVFILKKIVKSVSIPVSADIESGYAANNRLLKENIRRIIDAGIVGINFEDSNHLDGKLFSVNEQSEKIRLIKNTAQEMGSSLFINARTDVFIKENHLGDEEKLSETIRRGRAYREAGADGFYPIIVKKQDHIERIVKEVSLPLNLLLLPGIPDFKTLQEAGVARLSLGPGFLKTAINALKATAAQLLHYEGMNEIVTNPVTSEYLANLILKKQ